MPLIEAFGLDHAFNLTQEALKDKNITALLEAYFLGSDRMVSPVSEAFLVTIYALMSLSAIVTNGCILKVILRTTKLYIPTYLLLVNLMIADLALAIVTMPFTLVMFIKKSWPFGWLFCKIIPMTQGVAVIATSLTIAMIAADRCFRITSMTPPMSTNSGPRGGNFSKPKLFIEIGLIWVISIIIAFPQALYQEQVEIGIPNLYSYYKCVEKWPTHSRAIYSLSVLFFQLIIPSACLLISFFRIRMCLKNRLSNVSEALASINCTNNSTSGTIRNGIRGSGDASVGDTIGGGGSGGFITRNSSSHSKKSFYLKKEDFNELNDSNGTYEHIIIDVGKISHVNHHHNHHHHHTHHHQQQQQQQNHVNSYKITEINVSPANSWIINEKCNEMNINDNLTNGCIEKLNDEDEFKVNTAQSTSSNSSPTSHQSLPTGNPFKFKVMNLNLNNLENESSSKSFKINNNGQGSPMTDSHADRIIREIYRNRRVTNTLLCVTGAFAFCWIPWNLVNSYLDFSPAPAMIPTDMMYSLLACCHVIAMTSATINALLYGYTNSNIRRELRRLRSRSPIRSPGSD